MPPGAKGSTPGNDASATFVRPLFTLNINKNNEPFGKLVFELATDVLPRTTENFKQLAQGVTVGDKKSPKTATYRGCRFLRLSAEGLQTGDALHRDDGKGNDSIYGPQFDDEAFGVYPHRFGTLSMCNSGPNTNGSQFFICRSDCPFLDQRHVAFGKLVEGEDVLAQLIAELSEFTDEAGWGRIDPAAPFTVAESG